MHTELVTKLIQKRLTFPAYAGPAGNSRTLARQLDTALMAVGFKLSRALLANLGGLDFTTALKAATTLLDGVKALVGDHVQHNVYFKEFPKNVPDTLEFWGRLLADYYEQTGTITFNLLDFPAYGRYQHTYEEMLAAHDAFKPKGRALKVINLGGPEREELEGLCGYLAGSVVPLNPEDRGLLEALYKAGFIMTGEIPVRENRAIINGLRLLAGGTALTVDTVTDVLRVAAYLSGGDVTLAEKVKFKSFSRPIRRALTAAVDQVVGSSPEKIEDINNRKELFKRLAERIHPFEFKKLYPEAVRAFQFATGDLKVLTWSHKVQTALGTGKLTKAINLLSEKPGYLVRSIDQIARKGSDEQFLNLIMALEENVNRVAGRVLLSVIEHLDNRKAESTYRLFINRKGTGFASDKGLSPLAGPRITKLQKLLWKELARRVPATDTLVIDERLATVATPISEKSKSEGFRVLPRGSTFALDPVKHLLRFFCYWKQKAERTDYDLSVAFYDKDFQSLGHGSWTNLCGTGFSHSGDITSAPKGASEMIELDLRQIDKNIHYVVPTINIYSGETFAQCEESFFGFMTFAPAEKGKPFEPRAVELKFDLRGDKKVGMPLVFERGTDGWSAKWLDLYAQGSFWGNRVETTKFSTALLAKSLVTRHYLSIDRLLDLYRKKATRVVAAGKLPKTAVTYVGLERPEGLADGSTVYTLDNLKSLIPA